MIYVGALMTFEYCYCEQVFKRKSPSGERVVENCSKWVTVYMTWDGSAGGHDLIGIRRQE